MVAITAARWFSKKKNRRKVVLTGIAATALLGGSLIYAGAKSRKKDGSGKKRPKPEFKDPVQKGTLLCPAEESKTPISGKSVDRNDHVILKLQSADKSFSEEVWGRVLSIRPGKRLFGVELVTPLVSSGFKTMHTDKHGFHLAEKINVRPECFYDVLHKVDHTKFSLICGVMIKEFGYEGIPVGVFTASPGDLVTILVGNPGITAGGLPGGTWTDEVHVRISSVGRTGDVLHGVVVGTPSRVLQHGLSKDTIIEFARDCIVKS